MMQKLEQSTPGLMPTKTGHVDRINTQSKLRMAYEKCSRGFMERTALWMVVTASYFTFLFKEWSTKLAKSV